LGVFDDFSAAFGKGFWKGVVLAVTNGVMNDPTPRRRDYPDTPVEKKGTSQW
jgi:hypothetical protein